MNSIIYSDFLGKELQINDNVVCLVYGGTSARLYKGIVLRLKPKTLIVELIDDEEVIFRERKFDYSKVVKIG